LPQAPPPRELQLVNWPLRDDAPRAWLVIGCAVAAAVVISAITTSTAAGLAAFTALALAMWRLWLPVRFVFGPEGITETILGRRRRISWRKVRAYAVRRRGVMLYPFPEELRIAAPKSLYIRGGRQLERLVEVISFYAGSPAARRGSASSVRRATPPAAPEPPVTHSAPAAGSGDATTPHRTTSPTP
jgi:hypothetical protein